MVLDFPMRITLSVCGPNVVAAVVPLLGWSIYATENKGIRDLASGFV